MKPDRSAVVIGSGFGGLALAIRLQSGGVRTTIVEARDRPGGRAYVWKRGGYTFDAGPTVITDPACLRALWELTGADMAADVELIAVNPFYRLLWNDGTQFNYSNDEAQLNAEIAALDPADVAGYARFLEYSKGVYEAGYVKLGAVPFLDFTSMIKAAPALMKHQAWRSVYSVVCGFVRNEKLRQALSFHTLLVGGNPMTTSSIYALIHKLEKGGGVWFARGGTSALVGGMVAHFERLGGRLVLGDPVIQIQHEGKRVTAVTCKSGATHPADMVATNGDLVHSYGLITGSAYAALQAGWAQAPPFLAKSVRRAFRTARVVSRHSPSFNPVLRPLWAAAGRHLPEWTGARRPVDLPPPSQRNRSRHGSGGPRGVLCAGPGAASWQIQLRLGPGRRGLSRCGARPRAAVAHPGFARTP